MKPISGALLGLFCFFTGWGQVEFYGNPEAIGRVNSASGENYIYLAGGSTIYFTREKHPENTGGIADRGDIWVSDYDSAWLHPDVNDADFASPLGVTPDGRHFLYSKVWFDKGLYYGGVFAQSMQQDGVSVQLRIPHFKNRSPIQTGSLSPDGRYLLLSLENHTGYGVDDLYVSVLRPDGTWSTPKNLGYTINTSFQEVTPFLAADNRTLFFASNGREGEGSFDLFVATRLDDTWQQWSAPKNLGTSVNTPGAETSFAFIPGAEYAYFVSTQNSDGYGDIKRIRIQDEIEVAAPDTVRELKTVEAKHPVTFQLRDKRSHDPIAGKALLLTGVDTTVFESDSSGRVVLPEQQDEVSLEFKAAGYLSVMRTVDAGHFARQDTLWEVLLEPLATGNTITLQHVLFYRGTANFVEGSEGELDMVVEMLRENPDIRIFLKGHTDNVGNDVLNLELSRHRVKAVTDYLTGRGIDPGRISGEGYGGSMPLVSNDTEATRRLNRRVEFEVIRD